MHTQHEKGVTASLPQSKWYGRGESNPHEGLPSAPSKEAESANSSTPARKPVATRWVAFGAGRYERPSK